MGKINGRINEKGVTLVEVLASLALLSIIVLLVSSTQLFAQKQFNIQSNEVNIQSNERLALKIVTQEIRKAKTVTVNQTNELTINGTDVYKLQNKNLLKNNSPIVSDISTFTVTKQGNQLTIQIGNLPETNIYMRE